MWNYISRSTLKREFATVVMLWWLALGTYLLVRIPPGQAIPDAAVTIWVGLATFVFGLAVGAFGTDWISKQTTIAGPPSSGEVTVKTEVKEDATVTTATTETKGD